MRDSDLFAPVFELGGGIEVSQGFYEIRQGVSVAGIPLNTFEAIR